MPTNISVSPLRLSAVWSKLGAVIEAMRMPFIDPPLSNNYEEGAAQVHSGLKTGNRARQQGKYRRFRNS
jgi:hypothetical protein